VVVLIPNERKTDDHVPIVDWTIPSKGSTVSSLRGAPVASRDLGVSQISSQNVLPMGSMTMEQQAKTVEAFKTGDEPKMQEESKTEPELRRSPRLQCSGLAGIQTLPACEKPCPARIVNLSIGGCLMELEKPLTLAKDEIVELIFCVNQMPFRVRGKVRAIRSEILVGFQFPQLSDRIRRQLEDLVGELIDHLKKLHQVSLENRLLQDDARIPRAPQVFPAPDGLTRQPIKATQGLPRNAAQHPAPHRRWL
jgi:hypothetical protein